MNKNRFWLLNKHNDISIIKALETAKQRLTLLAVRLKTSERQRCKGYILFITSTHPECTSSYREHRSENVKIIGRAYKNITSVLSD